MRSISYGIESPCDVHGALCRTVADHLGRPLTDGINDALPPIRIEWSRRLTPLPACLSAGSVRDILPCTQHQSIRRDDAASKLSSVLLQFRTKAWIAKR